MKVPFHPMLSAFRKDTAGFKGLQTSTLFPSGKSNRRSFAVARLLRFWVRIPRGGGMDVCLLRVLCVVRESSL